MSLTRQQDSASYHFEFESTQEHGVISSYLGITDNIRKFQTKNFTETLKPAFRFIVHENVISESRRIIDEEALTSDITLSLFSQFEEFAKEVVFNQEVDFSADILQELFVHHAILGTVNRSVESKTECSCTPHPSYLVGNKSFWCQEDYKVDTKKFTEVIIESGKQLNQKELEVLNYLISIKDKSKFVTIDVLLEMLEDKETYMKRVHDQYRTANGLPLNSSKTQECYNGLGTALGCCGNYSGCCWVWSLACLEHDIVCHACDRWHCGPGCVPSW